MNGEGGGHRCERFEHRLVWSEWRERGVLRERVGRAVPFCAECGAERPRRTPRRRVRLEVEAARPERGLLLSAEARMIAERLLAALARRDPLPARGFLGGLGRAGSEAEAVLETLTRHGSLRLGYRLRGSRRALEAIASRDRRGLEELVRPGYREEAEAAVRDALGRVRGLDHPVAEEVARLLGERETEGLAPAHVRALAAVAEHAATGEVLSRRVFSTRYLGDSKALDRVGARLRGLLGPLERLGIREGEALTLVGGAGRLGLGGANLVIGRLPPYVGLSRETLGGLERVEAAGGRLLVVENLAAFEACCRGEVRDLRDRLVVWSAGYPGRGVRALVETAARGGAEVEVWADLDLDGVRIARLVMQWAPGARPVGMGPADLAAAPVTRRLEVRGRRAIEADVAARPDAPLAATLRAILESGRWAEQETFLAPR